MAMSWVYSWDDGLAYVPLSILYMKWIMSVSIPDEKYACKKYINLSSFHSDCM